FTQVVVRRRAHGCSAGKKPECLANHSRRIRGPPIEGVAPGGKELAAGFENGWILFGLAGSLDGFRYGVSLAFETRQRPLGSARRACPVSRPGRLPRRTTCG